MTIHSSNNIPTKGYVRHQIQAFEDLMLYGRVRDITVTRYPPEDREQIKQLYKEVYEEWPMN